MPKKITKTKKKEIKKVKKVKKEKSADKKVKEKKVRKKKIIEPKVKKLTPYFEAVGRRKTAVARVRLWTQGEQEFLVNNKSYQDYFPNSELQQIATDSLRKMKSLDRFKIKVLVKGSGLYSQAEAIRHGISRVLVKFNPDFT